MTCGRLEEIRAWLAKLPCSGEFDGFEKQLRETGEYTPEVASLILKGRINRAVTLAELNTIRAALSKSGNLDTEAYRAIRDRQDQIKGKP